MSQQNNVVSIHPYFKVHAGKMNTFKALLPQFVARTATEKDCLCYDFTISDDVIFCRESYIGAEATLAHITNVGDLLDEALKISDLLRLEFHGPTAELEKLKPAMSALNPTWFAFECGVAKPTP